MKLKHLRLPKFSSLYRKWIFWFRLKKLKHEAQSSQEFKLKCERLRCFTLADLEEQHRKEIQTQIQQLEKEQ